MDDSREPRTGQEHAGRNPDGRRADARRRRWRSLPDSAPSFDGWKAADQSTHLLAEVIASAFASGLSWSAAHGGKPVFCPPRDLKGAQAMSALSDSSGTIPTWRRRPMGTAWRRPSARRFLARLDERGRVSLSPLRSPRTGPASLPAEALRIVARASGRTECQANHESTPAGGHNHTLDRRAGMSRKGANRAYRGRLGKDRSACQSRHSVVSAKWASLPEAELHICTTLYETFTSAANMVLGVGPHAL